MPIFEQNLKVKEGINFILSHFEVRQPLFPRKMSTSLSNGRQFTVYNQVVLWTGNGYHIYIVVNTRPLELNVELSQLSKNPSEQFLRFSEMKLSSHKSDPSHKPSFKSCMLRIPHTLNSKYVLSKNPEVLIIQSFDISTIPKLDAALLREYRIYLADLDIKEKLKILKLMTIQNFGHGDKYFNNIPREYKWIENYLLKTPIADHRKRSIDLLLAPFLVNVKKSNDYESCSAIMNWIMLCNDLIMLHPNIKYFAERVCSAIKNSNTNKILPIKREIMQKKYPDWYHDFKSWELF